MEPYPVAILAGGLATRMRPLTEQTPKCLLEVAGEPFLAHQLRLLHSQNISRVVLCVGHLGEQVEQYVRRGPNANMDVSFSFDGGQLRGTAGALRKALPLLGEKFFVLYGDSYLRCSYLAMQEKFERERGVAMMSVLRNEGRWDASNIELRDGEIARYSKRERDANMRHVDYGLSILTPAALNYCGAADLSDVFEDLVRRNLMGSFEVFERFYEIGSPQGLRELEEYLLSSGTGRT